MSLSEIGDRLVIDPTVLSALDLAVDQIAAMGLREFFDLVTDAGFDVKFSTQPAASKEGGKLTINHAPQPAHAPYPLP